MDEDAPRYTNLRDYGRLLRKQWLLILVPAVLAVAAALAYSLHETPSYQSQAQVLIQDETQQLSLLGTPVATTSATLSSPGIVAQTINTPVLARAVQRDLRTAVPAADLMSGISLSVDTSTGLLDVTATARSATFAAALANAYARQIALQTTNSVRHQFATAAAVLQHRVRQLSPTAPGDGVERAALQDEISRLQFLQATSRPGEIASPAAVPGAPSSPKTTRNAALGLLAGLLIGLIAAFVRDAFDRRPRGSAEITEALGLALLGQVRGKTLGKAVDPAQAGNTDAAGDVETFRILRNNVELLATAQERHTVLVTSALPEEGKSTVAASLALASAAAGRRTLLIEADLRRPSLAGRLGLTATPGLAEYLVGAAEPEDVVRAIPLGPLPSRNGHGADPAGAPVAQLACVTAGRPHTGSAELLASRSMRDLLAEVASVYELVILDTSPLLPVADTLSLLPLTDAVVLCVRAGRTTRDQLRAAGQALARIPADAAGVVVTDVRASDEPAGHGLYPYYYSYADRPTP